MVSEGKHFISYAGDYFIKCAIGERKEWEHYIIILFPRPLYRKYWFQRNKWGMQIGIFDAPATQRDVILKLEEPLEELTHHKSTTFLYLHFAKAEACAIKKID